MNKNTYVRRARAKVNLYLHVTKKRNDGYHDLDSLVTFADVGDTLTLTPSHSLSLSLSGPFASQFSAEERTLDRSSKNILAQTLWAIADYADKMPAFRVTLEKNIPLGAGLGGGSADAAALAHILCDLWDIPSQEPPFQKLLFDLGADVPLCFHERSCRLINAGENISQNVPLLPLNMVLVHPNEHSATKDVFEHNKTYTLDMVSIPSEFDKMEGLCAFLKGTSNDLTKAAQDLTPEIKAALQALAQQEHVKITRMSGSGSACFGLFLNDDDAQNAAQNIKNLYPSWWVQAITTI